MVAPRTQCKGDEHVANILKEIVEGGGEGVILQLSKSVYENGRSASLMKFKVTLFY